MTYMTKFLMKIMVLFATISITPTIWAEPKDRTKLGDLNCSPGEFAIRDVDGTWTCATGGASYIFISTEVHDGAFGAENWDNVCDAEAASAGLPDGDYKAWLSSVAGNFDARDILPPGPFYATDGIIIALSKADLLDGTLVNPILLRADRSFDGLPGPWTGTSQDGTASGYDCNNWSSNGGDAGGTTGGAGETTGLWTDGNQVFCSSLKQVFCIQTH